MLNKNIFVRDIELCFFSFYRIAHMTIFKKIGPSQYIISLRITKSHQMTLKLYIYPVTCLYDEVLRFKSSAARKAICDSTRRGRFNVRHGLIQTVIDTYDYNICSMNGLKSSHVMTMLLCQSSNSTRESKDDEYISRISKSEMIKPIDISEPVQHYHGSKKPDMLDHSQLAMSKRDILLHSQEVSLHVLKRKSWMLFF